MQILTQGGGYITVHSVRSNEASFYIMDYEESNDSVHFFVKTVIETYNLESDEIARLLLWMQ